jgi:hypothetical protein
MRIFILLLLGLVISGCQRSGSDIRADLNLAVLTVASEEEFRDLAMLKEFKSKVNEHKFTTDVSLQLLVHRLKHCANSENQIIGKAWLVKNALEINNFENTYVTTASRPLSGYSIWEVWELNPVTTNKTDVTLYIKGSFDQSSKFKAQRMENYWAKGLSEEDSIMYFACKF